MNAVIMAGGNGTRLRPLTCCTPKPMVPLLNYPVIDYGVNLLKLHGIEDITATLHYLPNRIKDHLGDGSALGVRMQYCVEETPMGTAGSVREAAKDFADTFVVISGDALTDVDLTRAIQWHREKQSKVTILLKKVDLPMEYGVTLLDKQHRITRFMEKPGLSEVFSDLANTGMYIIEPEVMRYIPDTGKFDFSKDLFPLLMREGIALYGYEMQGY